MANSLNIQHLTLVIHPNTSMNIPKKRVNNLECLHGLRALRKLRSIQKITLAWSLKSNGVRIYKRHCRTHESYSFYTATPLYKIDTEYGPQDQIHILSSHPQATHVTDCLLGTFGRFACFKGRSSDTLAISFVVERQQYAGGTSDEDIRGQYIVLPTDR